MHTRSIAGQASWLLTASYAHVDIEYAIHRHGGIFQLAPTTWDDFSILSITMPNVSAAAQLIQFDAAGFAISAGSACSSGTLKPSGTLLAFGVPEGQAKNTIRMSAGWNTTYDEILAFSRAWEGIAAKAS